MRSLVFFLVVLSALSLGQRQPRYAPSTNPKLSVHARDYSGSISKRVITTTTPPKHTVLEEFQTSWHFTEAAPQTEVNRGLSLVKFSKKGKKWSVSFPKKERPAAICFNVGKKSRSAWVEDWVKTQPPSVRSWVSSIPSNQRVSIQVILHSGLHFTISRT